VFDELHPLIIGRSKECFSTGVRLVEDMFDKNVFASWRSISSYFSSPGLTAECYFTVRKWSI
jgi:hypothetical protein